MKIKKNMIVAIMITFCFTASLCMIIPLRSARNPYDSWLDTDDDGQIGLGDLVLLAQSYGTTGDPTKNVNVTNDVLMVNGTDNQNVTVTNWPDLPQTYVSEKFTYNMSSKLSSSPLIFCGGYSRLGISIPGRTNASLGVNNNITIYPSLVYWYDESGECSSSELLAHNLNATIFNGVRNWTGYAVTYMIETKAPYCLLYFNNNGTQGLPADWWVTFEYAVYLRND